jgi:hypothetical protein
MAQTEPKLDLLILDTHNSKILAVGDASSYPTNFTTLAPTIQIKVPGYPEKTMSFVPKSIQVYNSESLGLSCEEDCVIELPDGLYRLVYSLTPAYKYWVEKYFLKVDKLYEKWDRAFLKTDILQCGERKAQDLKILQEAETYIMGAIASANNCLHKDAIDAYQKASDMLDAFIENRCY